MDDIWGIGESKLIQLEDIIEELLKSDNEEENQDELEEET